MATTCRVEMSQAFNAAITSGVSPENWPVANPGTNGPSEPDWKLPSSKGLPGGGCSQPKPVSSPNSLLTGNFTGNFAEVGPRSPLLSANFPEPQAQLMKFPKRKNRENKSGNREFSSWDQDRRLLVGR